MNPNFKGDIVDMDQDLSADFAAPLAAATTMRRRVARYVRPAGPVHPIAVRALHWVNAGAMVVMIGSGLAIQNAEPILPFAVPDRLTIGGDLIAALRWHLAVMWVLGINGLAYLAFGVWTGRFRRKLLPITPRAVVDDALAALTGRLAHDDLSVYNQIQRVLYSGVILVGILAVISGLALWKPEQFATLVMLLGDFDNARIVHFVCMALISGFTLVHVSMALLVPRSIRLMTLGGDK